MRISDPDRCRWHAENNFCWCAGTGARDRWFGVTYAEDKGLCHQTPSRHSRKRRDLPWKTVPINGLLFFLHWISLTLGITFAPVSVHAGEALLHPQLPAVPVYEFLSDTSAEGDQLRQILWKTTQKSNGTALQIQCGRARSGDTGQRSESLREPAGHSPPFPPARRAWSEKDCKIPALICPNSISPTFFFHTQEDALGGYRRWLYPPCRPRLHGCRRVADAYYNVCTLKWTGAAAESLASYPYEQLYTPSSSLAYQDVGHLQNVRYVNGSDTAQYQTSILQYGSVSAPCSV